MLPGFDAAPLKREFKRLMLRSLPPFMAEFLESATDEDARNSLGLGAGADIASAATLDLTARTGNLVRVTGTIEVTAITMSNGDKVLLTADGALPINVAGLLTYTCSPEDSVLVWQDGSGAQHVQLIRASATDTGMPVGAVFTVPANTAPQGSVKINGSLLSRTTYADLYAFALASGNMEADDATWSANRTANGTNGKFSPGDGATTFRIPDVRGDFPRFWSDGSTVDSGRTIGSYQADQFSEHTHRYNLAANVINGGSTTANLTDWESSGTAGGNVEPVGGNETRPRNTAWLACMKY